MAKKNFEESLAKLEKITAELESGDFTLEESLQKFDEGVKLTQFCSQKIEEAQQKVDVLLKKDGARNKSPFEFDENQQ